MMKADTSGWATDLDERSAKLAEIRARAGATEPGPWELFEPYQTTGWGWCVASEANRQIVARAVGRQPRKGNPPTLEFIAHSRADIDWLLAEVERLGSIGASQPTARLSTAEVAGPAREPDVDDAAETQGGRVRITTTSGGGMIDVRAYDLDPDSRKWMPSGRGFRLRFTEARRMATAIIKALDKIQA